MAYKSILNKQNFAAANANISDNGTFDLFASDKFSAPSDYQAAHNALEVVVKYENNLPAPEGSQVAILYNLTCVIESEDDGGNWHPILHQFRPFIKTENGDEFIMKLDPSLMLLDKGVPNDIFNGVRVIAVESLKQGMLPDNFRIKVQVNEFGFLNSAPTPGSFSSVDLSVSYRTYQI